MISREIEFGYFIFYGEVVHLALQRQFVAKAQAIIEQTETDIQDTSCFRLFQGDGHFVIMIPYPVVLTPDGIPVVINRSTFEVSLLESAGQVGFFRQEP